MLDDDDDNGPLDEKKQAIIEADFLQGDGNESMSAMTSSLAQADLSNEAMELLHKLSPQDLQAMVNAKIQGALSANNAAETPPDGAVGTNQTPAKATAATSPSSGEQLPKNGTGGQQD